MEKFSQPGKEPHGPQFPLFPPDSYIEGESVGEVTFLDGTTVRVGDPVMVLHGTNPLAKITAFSEYDYVILEFDCKDNCKFLLSTIEMEKRQLRHYTS